MHLPLDMKVEENTWEAFEKKLKHSISVYTGTLKNLYDLPSDIDASLNFNLSNNLIESSFDDGMKFVSETVRDDFNNTLSAQGYKSAAKLKDLVKNKQEKL